MTKTIAVFGAGGGMGISVARRFGKEDYQVALVARRREPLDQLVAELAEDGINAAGFTADLDRTDDIPGLVETIRRHFGRIDAVVYSPFSPSTLVPAADLDAEALRKWVNLYLLTPVELVHAVLPEMLARGAGGIVFGYGSSAVAPAAGLSGPVPVLAAARNYLHTLHAELKDRGVYAGGVAVRAVIERSEGQRAVKTGEMRLAVDLPVVDPDELADLIWELVAERDRVEVVYP